MYRRTQLTACLAAVIAGGVVAGTGSSQPPRPDDRAGVRGVGAARVDVAPQPEAKNQLPFTRLVRPS
jgi:hypothetical protein